MIEVVVTTCDSYVKAILPFSHLFNKYWGPETTVHVLGFSPCPFELPPNFNYVSVGPQERYPVDRWSDALIDALEGPLEHVRYFVLMLEDYWLIRDVNAAQIESLSVYMTYHQDVIKMDLMRERLYAAGSKDLEAWGSIDLMISDPQSQYHMSLMTGIWNSSNLLSLLQPGWSPWDVEMQGTTKLRNMPHLKVLGTRQSPIWHTLAHRRGDPSVLLLDDLRDSDVIELKDLGYI